MKYWRATAALLALTVSGCSRGPVSATPELTPAIQSADKTPPLIGRFQLLAAEHLVVGKRASFTDKDIFRIDTATGETSVFISGSGDNYWKPIEAYLSPAK